MLKNRSFKYKWLLCLFGAIVILRIFFIDYYKIDSGSMLPTIKPGNYILVNNFYNYLKTHRLTHTSFFPEIKKGSLYVFFKPEWRYDPNTGSQDTAFLGDEFVKRCVGLPGDTVYLNKPSIAQLAGEKFDIEGWSSEKYTFPFNKDFHWNINKFGPLWIPKKNSEIELTRKNIILYQKIIEREGSKIAQKGNTFYLNSKIASTYKFRQNYYFMLGDNFYASNDSRSWGLVPEGNIIGKVFLIL